ncbi:hypothetical protein FRC01_005650, partial [Tulasnella sp. 417]
GNILVNADRRALLADFGLSKALDTGPTGFTTGNDAKYTVRYASPEIVLEGNTAESLSNDIWSWACLVWEAFTDRIPFAYIEHEPQLILALAQGKSPSEANISLVFPQLKSLLGKCWNREPSFRPTAADCLCTTTNSSIWPFTSARGDGLQLLDEVFIDKARLKYEPGPIEIVRDLCGVGAILDNDLPTRKLVVVKRLRLWKLEIMPEGLAFRLARELKVWAGLKHPHVPPLLGFTFCTQSAYFIFEYMDDGNLKQYLTNMEPDFQERLSLSRDLIDGLTYLHAQNPPIRHGDLKPGNVLVNANRRAVLADFGLSKALDIGPPGFTFGNDAKHTVRYASPEIVLEGTAAESLSNDIWSWACLILEVLTDKIPFADLPTEPRLLLALLLGRSPSVTDLSPSSPLPELTVLLRDCWSHQPMERPTALYCLRVMDSSLLWYQADRTENFPSRFTSWDQGVNGGGSVSTPGRATAMQTRSSSMDSIREILPSDLSLISSGPMADRIRPQEPSTHGGVHRSARSSRVSAAATSAAAPYAEPPSRRSSGNLAAHRPRSTPGPAAFRSTANPNPSNQSSWQGFSGMNSAEVGPFANGSTQQTFSALTVSYASQLHSFTCRANKNTPHAGPSPSIDFGSGGSGGTRQMLERSEISRPLGVTRTKGTGSLV